MFENSIKELTDLKDGEYLSFDKIEYWLLKHGALYSQTKDNYDCSNFKLPCMCWSRKKDCLFIDIFDALEKISKMYHNNLFYANEINKYAKIKEIQIEEKKWLTDNLKENDIDLPYSTTNGIYHDKIISLSDGKNDHGYNTYVLKIKGEDFKSSYDFLNIYNDLFFTQKILPKEYEIWKIDTGYIEFKK
jgi:hypothetical protein